MSEVGAFDCAAHLGDGKTCRVPTNVASIEWVKRESPVAVRVIVPLCREHGPWLLHDAEDTMPLQKIQDGGEGA